jgi:hypothetical protein
LADAIRTATKVKVVNIDAKTGKMLKVKKHAE